MLLKLLDHMWQGILEEVYYAFKIQLRAEHVKEHILAIALVEFADHVDELVEHWEALT